MLLLDLEPRWLIRDGIYMGFMFKSPTDPKFWQTCMFFPTERRVQRELIAAVVEDKVDRSQVQMCNPGSQWVAAPIDFAKITVRPSLDGSAGGLWHGFITDGQIVGGV